MADYSKAYKITIIGNEGGYNPGVGEKETYRGIDRGANPQWTGWLVIDKIKATHPGLPVKQMDTLLLGIPALQSEIATFFKANYWDTFKGDRITDQQIADNLFDCSVNQGEGLANRIMQQACNNVILNTGSAMKLVTVDKVIGVITLAAANSLSAQKIFNEINALREESYRNDKEFEEDGTIWLKRLIKYV